MAEGPLSRLGNMSFIYAEDSRKLKIQPKKMCISVQWEPTLPTRLIIQLTFFYLHVVFIISVIHFYCHVYFLIFRFLFVVYVFLCIFFVQGR